MVCVKDCLGGVNVWGMVCGDLFIVDDGGGGGGAIFIERWCGD